MIGMPGRQLILFVTQQCPLRCVHCFNRQAPQNLKGPEINVEEARLVGRELKPIGQLSISGGEPFVRKDLPELIEAVRAEGGARYLDIPTAGWQPGQVQQTMSAILKQRAWRRISLNLSLDGDVEQHDRIRGRAGSYERLIETYRSVLPLRADSRLQLKAVITLMQGTAGALDQTLNAMRRDMPQLDYAHVEPYRGPDLGEGIAPPSAQSMRQCRELVFGLYRGRRGLGPLRAAFKRVLWDEYTELLDGGPPRINCRAPDLGLVVGERLEVSFCEPGPLLGSLREQSLAQILAGPRARSERERIARGCACTHSCFMQPSALYSPRAWTRVPLMLIKGGGR
ncbi:MAG: radical SAM protein [Candidatus Alcyoniella australis]|nr:radical SAM protein [Candidatus Alcyoniella australis]